MGCANGQDRILSRAFRCAGYALLNVQHQHILASQSVNRATDVSVVTHSYQGSHFVQWCAAGVVDSTLDVLVFNHLAKQFLGRNVILIRQNTLRSIAVVGWVCLVIVGGEERGVSLILVPCLVP